MSLPLRPYQLAALDAVSQAWAQGRRRVVITLPTGAGKTLTLMELARRALAKGGRVLWTGHRHELLQQPYRTALALGIPAESIGIVKAEEDDVTKPLVIASTPTLARESRRARLFDPALPPFRLYVADEAHHAAARSHRSVAGAVPQNCMVVGITATPERTDGESLAHDFPGGVAYSYSLSEAIRDGWLCDFKAVQVDVPELILDALALGSDGDYDDSALAEAMRCDAVIRATAGAWRDHCAERRSLVFCAGVAQATETVTALRAAGARAALVIGETPQDERDAHVAALRRREIDALVNVQVFTEGTDIPEADAVVMARPTLSKSLYMQCLGRGLRIAESKRDGCLIVDLVGCSALHQPVTAPVLVGAARGSSAWLGREGLGDGKPTTRNWDVASRARVYCHWTELGGEAVAASGPERSMVIVRPVGAGGWLCDFWHGDTRESLTPAPVWRELAVSLGEDVIRRLEGAKKLVKAGADWRAGEPSEKQRAALARCGIAQSTEWTRGDCADAMTRFFAARLLRRVAR